MEFMGFHIVDIVIATLILFLAIKGLINGFSKELLSLITIVGGISLAANFNIDAVNFINEQHVIPTISENYAKIVGFIAIFVAVWLVIGLFSSIINKLGSSSISPISRIFGYIVSATRYFAILSLIVFGINQSEFFKNKAKKLKTETKLFVPMTKVGASILNIDLRTKSKEDNSSNNLSLNSHDTIENETIGNKLEENRTLESKKQEYKTTNTKINNSKEELTSIDDNLLTEDNSSN